MNNDFEVVLQAIVEDGQVALPLLSAAVVSWSDEGEVEQSSYLLPEDADEEESHEDDDEADDEQPGQLSLQVKMSAAVFAEYRKLRDNEDVQGMLVTIIYKEGATPVYHHEYTLNETMFLVQAGATKVDSDLVLELTGTYYDCIQFATFAESEEAVH